MTLRESGAIPSKSGGTSRSMGRQRGQSRERRGTRKGARGRPWRRGPPEIARSHRLSSALVTGLRRWKTRVTSELRRDTRQGPSHTPCPLGAIPAGAVCGSTARTVRTGRASREARPDPTEEGRAGPVSLANLLHLRDKLAGVVSPRAAVRAPASLSGGGTRFTGQPAGPIPIDPRDPATTGSRVNEWV